MIPTIVNKESLYGEGAVSGDSFKAYDGKGRVYKLRELETEQKATFLENRVQKLLHVFPEFYGRKGETLFFAWVEGTLWYDVWENDLPETIYAQLGEMLGEAHALNEVSYEKTGRDFFDKMLAQARPALSQELEEKITAYFTHFSIDPEIVLEINDVHPRNFIIENLETKPKLYFIDEAGFGFKIKGLGLAKPLYIEKTVPEKYLQTFWKAYTKHYDSSYFTKEYRDYVVFLQHLRSIASRVRTSRSYKTSLRALEKVVSFRKA